MSPETSRAPRTARWTSDSEGLSEQETSDGAIGQIMIDLPGEVYSLKTTTSTIIEDLKQIVKALTLAKQGMEQVAALNGIDLKLKSKETLDKLRSVPENPAFADDKGKQRKDDDGGCTDEDRKPGTTGRIDFAF